MKIFVSILLAFFLTVGGAAADREEIYFADQTFIDDVYMFVLPIPPGYFACQSLRYWGNHGFMVLLSGSNCAKHESVPSLYISAYWSNFESAEAPGAIEEECSGGTAARTKAHFGDAVLYRCDKRRSGAITYFAIKVVHTSERAFAIVYYATASKISGDLSKFEKKLDGFVSQARFTTE